jgi:2-polyprenyl-3-methyl-5-hydroxy-6-metoxy-1,4-benzoquinol methylase
MDLARARSAGYADAPRTDALRRLRGPLGRVLDVGCGKAASADLLREMGATRITGIEADPEAAAVARGRYDHVLEGRVESVLADLPGPFDTVLCYDVLEHLYDPWTVLRELATRVSSRGLVDVSIPNARFVRVWAPLVFRGTAGYEAEGYRDVTHIRFFTRSDAVAMLEGAGLEIEAIDHPPAVSLRNRIASALTGGRSAELLTGHWFISARPR